MGDRLGIAGAAGLSFFVVTAIMAHYFVCTLLFIPLLLIIISLLVLLSPFVLLTIITRKKIIEFSHMTKQVC